MGAVVRMGVICFYLKDEADDVEKRRRKIIVKTSKVMLLVPEVEHMRYSCWY